MATARRSIRRVVSAFAFGVGGGCAESGRSSVCSLVDSEEERKERIASLDEVESETFSQVDDLGDWLTHHGVETGGWGAGTVKSIDSLLQEVRAQESSLLFLGGKVFRVLRVTKVVVRQAGRPHLHLANYQQKMEDGRLRDRNLLPSTKVGRP